MREVVADILLGLAGQRDREPRSAGRMLNGARALRWAERFEYGDPVPADEVDAMIEDEVQGAIDAAAEEHRQELDHRHKALENLEAAITAWDKGRDDKALTEALDEYRAVTR